MTSNPFKPGDLVRYVDNLGDEYTQFAIGRIYRVGLRDTVDEYINLEATPGIYRYGWLAGRFELAFRPGAPETWKPKPGDPVKFACGEHYDNTKVHHVIEQPDGEPVRDAVWIDYGGGYGWNYAPTWITWEGSLLTPMTHDEEATFAAPDEAEEPAALVPVEEPETLKLKAEILRLEEEVRRQAQAVTRAEEKLEAFRTEVRDAVIEEAEDRGWCEEVDNWLEKLGLEPRYSTYDLPTHRYAVVALTDGRIAVLEDTDWREGCPWVAYSLQDASRGWLSFEAVNDLYSRTLFLGDEEQDAVTEYH
jgi:hypothetical protein